MPARFKLLAGLGNPGREYAETRHNVGFWFIDALIDEFSIACKTESRHQAVVGRWQTSESDCYLCKPTNFMNRSGYAVQSIANFYKISPQNILIVHDELDIAAGIVRLKKGGGHGGHNGLRDIISAMGSNLFSRLRIGIGHPGSRERVTPYVLSKPSLAERTLIEQTISTTIGMMPDILQGDLDSAMNILHKR